MTTKLALAKKYHTLQIRPDSGRRMADLELQAIKSSWQASSNILYLQRRFVPECVNER